MNNRAALIQGLWSRLERNARGSEEYRKFVIRELTIILSDGMITWL